MVTGWILSTFEGFSRGCLALRQRTSSLIVSGDALVQRRVDGSALDVLNEVLTWEMGVLNAPPAAGPAWTIPTRPGRRPCPARSRLAVG